MMRASQPLTGAEDIWTFLSFEGNWYRISTSRSTPLLIFWPNFVTLLPCISLSGRALDHLSSQESFGLDAMENHAWELAEQFGPYFFATVCLYFSFAMYRRADENRRETLKTLLEKGAPGDIVKVYNEQAKKSARTT